MNLDLNFDSSDLKFIKIRRLFNKQIVNIHAALKQSWQQTTHITFFINKLVN